MCFGLTTVKSLPKRRNTSRFHLGFLCAIGLVCLLTGCRQVGFAPSSLPAEYAALPTINVNSLDLSRLASAQSNSSAIFPGDRLNVTVATGAEDRQPTPWPVTVAEDGTVEIPLVGPIQVAGLDVRRAQGLIRDASIHRGIYRQPSVSMSLESRRTNRISVVGAVEQPGSYELPVAGSDLLSALIAAGGLSDDADRILEIRLPAQPTPTILPTGIGQVPIEVARTSYDSSTGQHPPQTLGPRSIRLDLVAATTSPQSQDYRLDDGAIVMVRKLPPRYVHVIGLVQKPNRFKLPPGEDVRILDAIAMAQGLKISLADRAYVIRQIPNATEPVVVEVSIRKAKTTPADNILLTDGDVVSVEETPLTFVFGTLKNVVRIGLTSSLSLF